MDNILKYCGTISLFFYLISLFLGFLFVFRALPITQLDAQFVRVDTNFFGIASCPTVFIR
jgi:hypothetical protein